MRKTLAVILCALMILPLAFVGISAAEPVAVSSAADFAAMDPAGSYKLTADITVDAAYGNGETVVPFTGTFDGGGHTITLVDVPLFIKLHEATVQNLKLAGTAKGGRDLGALAIEGYGFTVKNVTNNANVIGPAAPTENSWIGGFVGEVYATSGHGTAEKSCPTLFENCVNNGNVDMSHSSKDARAGGFVGNAAKYQKVTFKNCVNNGNVTYTGTKTNAYVAGIVGGCFGGEYINCTNNGKITGGPGSSVGGLLGRGSPSSQGGDQSETFTGCVNNGDISGDSGNVGGMFGHIAEPKDTTFQLIKIDQCTNTGNITGGGSNAGGLAGYVWANNNGTDTKPYSHAEVTNSINTGKVTAAADGTFVSQFLAYTNSIKTVIKNNIGAGETVAKDANRDVIVGLSSADATKYTIENNYLVKAPTNLTYASSADYAANVIAVTAAPAGAVVAVTAEQLASGEVAYLANQNAGSTVFYQTLGSDSAPVINKTHKTVILDNGTYANDAAAPTPATPTGDAAVWVLVITAVSLLGMGIALKARKA